MESEPKNSALRLAALEPIPASAAEAGVSGRAAEQLVRILATAQLVVLLPAAKEVLAIMAVKEVLSLSAAQQIAVGARFAEEAVPCSLDMIRATSAKEAMSGAAA